MSIAVALVIGDTVLRYAAPWYDNWMVARPTVEDPAFLHSKPDECQYRNRPDTGERHRVIHNRYGMRQNRPVFEHKPSGVTRIAIFGDSFTENIDVDLPFSFVEVLQHLFDGIGDYEVLNFGTYSWGADQEYARYRLQGRRFDPDVVVYVFYDNDIAEMCRHPWFEIDDAGEPVKPGFPTAPAICAVPLTCALRDARDRWAARRWAPREGRDLWGSPSPWAEGEPPPRAAEWMRPSWYTERSCLQFSRPVYARIARHWRDAVAESGGRLLTVMTPESLTSPGELEGRRGVAELFRSLGVPVADLTDPFAHYAESTPTPLRFASDHHWNEEGCKLAAVEIFRFLLDAMGVPQPSAQDVGRSLAHYYAAFPSADIGDALIDAEARPTPEEIRTVVARFRGAEMRMGLDQCDPLPHPRETDSSAAAP